MHLNRPRLVRILDRPGAFLRYDEIKERMFFIDYVRRLMTVGGYDLETALDIYFKHCVYGTLTELEAELVEREHEIKSV